jgi:membrane glycosyltransferase
MYMGHASYIGHNAMIRLKPFMDHCILPELPGRAPWGGKPLSHDIVESALMARAGYEVWFLPEVTGSYEEVPSNLVDFLIRERRWMQGNLQHFHFLFVDGLRGVHRETFITGSMGYVAAPLWAIFLVVSVYGMFHFLNTGIPAVDSIGALAVPAATLIASSMVFLFMPRLLALAIHIPSHRARLFGGKDKLVWSMLLETAFSFLFSPILMICLSRFIWLWLRRRSIAWDAQVRGDEPLRWAVCLRYFGWVSALGALAWLGVIHGISQVPDQRAAVLQALSGGWLRPNDMFVWLLPILAGLAFSAMIARATSFSFAGITDRRLFAIPEEVAPPPTVRAIERWEARFRAWLADLDAPDSAIRHASEDRGFFVQHRRETRYRPRIAAALLPHIQSGAPLSARQAFLAIGERRCFDELHRRAATPPAYARWAAQ